MILMKDIQMNIEDESDKLQVEINEDKEALSLGLDEKFVEGTNDYNKLKNKPKLNGNEIIGEVEEIDPTVPTWAKAETKTYEKIGNTDIDLSAYVKKSELTAITTNDLNTMWG